MALTPAQVRHIAKLARLTIKDDEVEKFSRELSAILDYVAKLQEVDTKNVEPARQVTGLADVYRADEITNPTDATESLLATSPLPIVEQQIETPSAHG